MRVGGVLHNGAKPELLQALSARQMTQKSKDHHGLLIPHRKRTGWSSAMPLGEGGKGDLSSGGELAGWN